MKVIIVYNSRKFIIADFVMTGAWFTVGYLKSYTYVNWR